MALTITSANAIYLLSIDGVYTAPQALVGFGVSEAFDTEVADIAEVQMGVDGLSASGWLPRLTTQTITLLAASPSFRIFEDWVAAQDTLKDILYATGEVHLPSIGRKYSMEQGTLTRFAAMPNAKRTLEQRTFTIVWAHGIIGAPI